MSKSAYRVFAVSMFVILIVLEASVIVVSFGYVEHTVEDGSTRTYYFNGHEMEVEIAEYKERTSLTRNFNMEIVAHQFVTPNDPVIQAVYKVMEPELSLMDDYGMANALYEFVYFNIWYESDESVYGRDYAQFPSETLLLEQGDCEDYALLLYTFYEAAGLDAVLLDCENHMTVGVAVDAEGETFHRFMSDVEYYHVDPTNGHPIGSSLVYELNKVYKADRVVSNEVVLIVLFPVLFVTLVCRILYWSNRETKVRRIKTVYQERIEDNGDQCQ